MQCSTYAFAVHLLLLHVLKILAWYFKHEFPPFNNYTLGPCLQQAPFAIPCVGHVVKAECYVTADDYCIMRCFVTEQERGTNGATDIIDLIHSLAQCR